MISSLRYKLGDIKSLCDRAHKEDYDEGFFGTNEKQVAASYILEAIENGEFYKEKDKNDV